MLCSYPAAVGSMAPFEDLLGIVPVALKLARGGKFLGHDGESGFCIGFCCIETGNAWPPP